MHVAVDIHHVVLAMKRNHSRKPYFTMTSVFQVWSKHTPSSIGGEG